MTGEGELTIRLSNWQQQPQSMNSRGSPEGATPLGVASQRSCSQTGTLNIMIMIMLLLSLLPGLRSTASYFQNSPSQQACSCFQWIHPKYMLPNRARAAVRTPVSQ